MKVKDLISILQSGDINDNVILTIKNSQTELVIEDVERHPDIGDTIIFELIEKK